MSRILAVRDRHGPLHRPSPTDEAEWGRVLTSQAVQLRRRVLRGGHDEADIRGDLLPSRRQRPGGLQRDHIRVRADGLRQELHDDGRGR